MSISKKLNNFEFESIDTINADILKNGLQDYINSLADLDLNDMSIDLIDAFELITENYYSNDALAPESFYDILDFLKPLIDITISETNFLENSKKIEHVLNNYENDPFLVSIIDVLNRNIDNNMDYEMFFEELTILIESLIE